MEEVENSSKAPRPAGAAHSWVLHEAWHQGKGDKGKAPCVQLTAWTGEGDLSFLRLGSTQKVLWVPLCLSLRSGGSGGRRGGWCIFTSADVLIFWLFLLGSLTLRFHT